MEHRAPSPEHRFRAYLALAAAVAGIAWSAIFVRWAGVPGTVSAFYRVLVAGVVLIPWAAARTRTRGAVPSRTAWIAVAGGLFFALDLSLWNTSIMKTQAAVAAVLGNNTPIFVGLMTWIFLHRQPRASFWTGLALSLGGCLLIMTANLRDVSLHGSLFGDVLALVAGVFFAAYLIVTERVRTKMDTLTFNALAIAGSIAGCLALAVLLRLPLTGYPPRAWAALIGLGLVSQLAAYYALVYALGHLPATITSVGLLAQVPCTAALAWVLLGEPLTAPQIGGGVLVLAGIVVVNRFS